MSNVKMNVKVDGTKNEKVGKAITVLTFVKLIPIYLISLIVLAGGVFCLAFAGNTSHRCTEKVEAVVVDYAEDEPMKVESKNGVKYYPMYAPMYNFTLNGQEYTVKSRFATDKKPYEIGAKIKLKVNPDDPTDTYAPADNSAKKLGFSLIGTALLFSGLATAIVLKIASAPKLAASLANGKIKVK